MTTSKQKETSSTDNGASDLLMRSQHFRPVFSLAESVPSSLALVSRRPAGELYIQATQISKGPVGRRLSSLTRHRVEADPVAGRLCLSPVELHGPARGQRVNTRPTPAASVRAIHEFGYCNSKRYAKSGLPQRRRRHNSDTQKPCVRQLSDRLTQ